jgi:bifunctional non-homologous end joining protein LigD
MPLTRRPEPFSHPDWLFEIKHDGFRALAYVENGTARLLSRNGNWFKSFPVLCDSLASDLRVRSAVLDGEIVCLDKQGHTQFNQLLYRRGDPCFYAFDLLFLNGRDLRKLPLIERKARAGVTVLPQKEELC